MPKSTASRSKENTRQQIWDILLGPERKRILSVPVFLLGAELYNNPFKLDIPNLDIIVCIPENKIENSHLVK